MGQRPASRYPQLRVFPFLLFARKDSRQYNIIIRALSQHSLRPMKGCSELLSVVLSLEMKKYCVMLKEKKSLPQNTRTDVVSSYVYRDVTFVT